MTDLPPLGAETDSAVGTPSLRFDLPAMGQEVGAQIGATCLIFGLTEPQRQQRLAELRERLVQPGWSDERRAWIQQRIAELEVERTDQPIYYIYPKPETIIPGPDGPRLVRLEVNPGPEFVRVAPRGGNPNCFIRTNDPYRHLAEEAS